MYLLNLTEHKFDFTTGLIPTVGELSVNLTFTAHMITHKERDLTAINQAPTCLKTRNSKVAHLSQGRGPNSYQARKVLVHQVLTKKLLFYFCSDACVKRLETDESGEVKK